MVWLSYGLIKKKTRKKKNKAILFNFSVKDFNSSEEVEPWFEVNGAQVFQISFRFVLLFPRNNDQSFEYRDKNLMQLDRINVASFIFTIVDYYH